MVIFQYCVLAALGYYLENVWDIKKCSGRMLGVWTLLGMAGIGLSCYMTYYMHGVTGICDEDNSQIFHSTFIVLPCIAIYVAVKFFAKRHVFSVWQGNVSHLLVPVHLVSICCT